MAMNAQRLERWGSWSSRRLPMGVETRTADESTVHHVTQDAIARKLHAIESRRGEHHALSRAEAERVRVRVELASVRPDSVALVPMPCSGREFDSPPDPADESAYDALEKAYNLAFAVSSSERLERAANEERLTLPDCSDESLRVIEKELQVALHQVVERKSRVLSEAELSSITDAVAVRTQEAFQQRQQAIEKLRQSVQRVDIDLKPIDLWRQSVIFSRDSVVECAKSMAVARTKRQRVLQHLAEACRSRVLGRSKTRNHAENGFARAAAPLKVQIPALPNPKHSVPTLPGTSLSEDGGHGIPQETKAVSDFLAAELSSLASFLTHGHHQELGDHSTATATSANLWREYQRALADLASESGRQKAWRTENAAHELDNPKERTMNPFQRLGDSFDGSWKSSLKSVEYGDCQTGSEGEDFGASPSRESEVSSKLTSLYERGLNGIVLCSGDGVQSEIASFILQAQRVRSIGNVNLLVTRSSRLQVWREALSPMEAVVLPQSREDMERTRTLVAADVKLSRCSSVLLVDIDTFADQRDVLSMLSLHLCIVDLDESPASHPQDSIAVLWPSILSLRCRQRVLISSPSVGVDVRTLALFTYPAAFCSRRKIMAWNCATLTKRHIVSIINAVSACVVVADARPSTLVEWTSSIEKKTVVKIQRETKTLQVLVKQVASVPTIESSGDTTTRLFDQDAGMRARISKRAIPRLGNSLASAEDVLRQSTQVKELPLKRRLHSRTHRSRKRVSRCGSCAGCLAEDCMTCGHCQDMKKYGGPGLRKQSCKKRKCIKPKTWGLMRKKPRRGDGTTGTESRDASEDDYSDFESDAGSTENGGDSALSSDESEAERGVSSAAPSAFENDSDSGYDSSHFSDETVDTMNRELHDVADGADLHNGHFESHSRAGRSRIMRCGKCRGCTSGDCMKCIHCRDMKKYGGLGLRKQSCKYRKCIAPKVVLLNQTREKNDDDQDSAETGSSYGGEDDMAACKRSVDVDSSDLLLSTARLDVLNVLQECELVVRKFLFFSCDVCHHAFISQKQLDRHLDWTHNTAGERDEWEETAEQLLMHPVHQLGCLIASRRSINPNWQAPPIRAFAKLEGHGFEYFLLKPFAVLGRLSSRWTKFYQSRGIASPKGLAGGAVDCHLGDDAMIGPSHALIQWDATGGYFTIECLTMRSSLSVNGRDVHFSSRPLALRSHDLIQIGSCTAYFLLPVVSESPSASQASAAPQIPRAEMRAWVDAAVAKRRAQRAQSEAIQTKIREITASQ